MSNDLISRQAAIDEIEGGAELIRRVLDNMDVVIDERGKFAYGLGLLESCIEELSELPSAQPEIIRCEDCRYANECHKSVQYTRNESNMMTIGYSSIEWCSMGKRREDNGMGG